MVEGELPIRADKEGKMQEKETLDERLPGLFEPDTLLPIQYFEALRKKHLLEGEKRLVLSVLEDAIECFMKCSSSRGTRVTTMSIQVPSIHSDRSAGSPR